MRRIGVSGERVDKEIQAESLSRLLGTIWYFFRSQTVENITRSLSPNISKESQPPARLYFLSECDTIERSEGRTNRYIP